MIVRSAFGMNDKDGEMPDPLSRFAEGTKQRGWPEESLKRNPGCLKPSHPAKGPLIGQSRLSTKFGIPGGMRSLRRDLVQDHFPLFIFSPASLSLISFLLSPDEGRNLLFGLAFLAPFVFCKRITKDCFCPAVSAKQGSSERGCPMAWPLLVSGIGECE